MVLELRNPHSVLAALSCRPQDVIELRLHGTKPTGAWKEVTYAAMEQGIPIRREVPRRKSRRSQHAKGTERSGAAQATVKPRNESTLHTLFADAGSGTSPAGLWIALDCLQDPHNVGAIFRTAAFFDVQGIVVTHDRSAPLNATVYDIASGGMEHVAFSVQSNLARTMVHAKHSGFWILGTSEHAEQDVSDIDRDRPWLLVLGNEEKGLRRLTRENCDVVCKLSSRGAVTSLNVSVAAGILIASLTGR